jgi:hypothetical protein
LSVVVRFSYKVILQSKTPYCSLFVVFPTKLNPKRGPTK